MEAPQQADCVDVQIFQRRRSRERPVSLVQSVICGAFDSVIDFPRLALNRMQLIVDQVSLHVDKSEGIIAMNEKERAHYEKSRLSIGI